MTGLLHRLSDLAINGTVSRLRPLPPNPWLPAPAPAAPDTPPTSAITGSSDTAAPAPIVSQRQDDATAPGTSARRSPNPLLDSGVRRPTTPRGDVDPATVGDGVPTRRTPVSSFAPLLPDVSAPTETVPVSEPSPARAAPDDRATADSSPTGSAPARVLPTPLITVPAAASAVQVAYHGEVSGPRAAHPREPATEVHVRIARVELTAVVEPVAPQPKSRPAHPGRTLDEYLQQRRERLG